LLFSYQFWVFNPGRKKQNQVFAFIVKRFRVFRAPLQNITQHFVKNQHCNLEYDKGELLN
ncbi:hypothetical protein, partial [Chryseobacterium indoltheticum]|uniref:hypothetical protein n=1 Tax=Chryseobacterium indoltheticum TaxID=254 RepID=UPI003F4917A1